MTWLYSSFPARSSAVVSPVTKWTCMILLISLLPSTLSSLQVWKILPPHPHGIMGLSFPLREMLQVLGLAGVENRGPASGLFCCSCL